MNDKMTPDKERENCPCRKAIINPFDAMMMVVVRRLDKAYLELKRSKPPAKEEVQKPFIQEEELKTKLARLDELNILLNMDKRENEIVGGEPDEGEVPNTRKEKTYER